MKKILVIALFALQACSDAGLIQTGTGEQVSIPRVKVGCVTAQCTRTATAPLISVVYTTSSCNDPLFGAVVSASTQSIDCSPAVGVGCTGQLSSWVTSAGAPTTTISSGTYQVCGCIQFSGGSTPWSNCDSLGTLNSVVVSNQLLLQILSWNH